MRNDLRAHLSSASPLCVLRCAFSTLRRVLSTLNRPADGLSVPVSGMASDRHADAGRSPDGKRLLLLAFSVFLISAASSPAQVPSRQFREAVSVNVESQVVKTIETAREHMIEGQWEQAIAILQQQINAGHGTVVPVETGRYWSTADYCHLLISQLPPSGLQKYRDRVDAQAREWFETGRESLSEGPLQRIVDTAFNSSWGEDALWLLGELAFEQGHFARARQYWQLLVPPAGPPVEEAEEDQNAAADETGEREQSAGYYLTYPDPAMPRAEVLARLILCSIFEGDRERAVEELAVFDGLESEASGYLAGRSGNLSDILKQVLEASGQWEDSQTFSKRRTVPGGHFDRNPTPRAAPLTREVLWTRSLPQNRFTGPASRQALSEDKSPPFFPLVRDNTVFVANSDSIFAFELDTGRPRWSIDESDDGRTYTNILERPVSPHLPSAGIATYPLSFNEGRLYARMGPPVMRRSRNEGNAFSEIVGLDVARREGELVFRITSDVFDPHAQSPEATSWSFAGTPLVAHGRVYVVVRRGAPEDEALVACFDADSSRLLWRRQVCAVLQTASDRFNLIGQNLLTLGDGRLFLATHTGAIASLDAETGRLLWVVTYQSDRQEQAHELSDPRENGLTPCVYHRGVVYAAPSDSEVTFALDATTGQLVWRRRFPDPVLHLVGVVDDRLILSGRSVWAVDARNGQPAWPQPIGFADPAGRGHGRPAVSPDSLYWPVRDEILRIDHRDGRVIERIRLREDFGMTAGNLVIADRKLLIAGLDQLVALGVRELRPPADAQRDDERDERRKEQREEQQNERRDDSQPVEVPLHKAKAVDVDAGPGDSRAARERKAVRLAGLQQTQASGDQSPLRSGRRNLAAASDAPTSATGGSSASGQPGSEEPESDVSLWPAKRAWSVPVSQDARVFFPNAVDGLPADGLPADGHPADGHPADGHPADGHVVDNQNPCGAVVYESGLVRCLDSGSGRELWTAHPAAPTQQIAMTGSVLVQSDARSITARDAKDGRLLWREPLKQPSQVNPSPGRPSPGKPLLRDTSPGKPSHGEPARGEPSGIIPGRDGRLFLISDSVARSVDAFSGETLWQVPVQGTWRARAAAHRSDRPIQFAIADGRLLFSPAGTGRFFLVDLTSGRLLSRGQLPFIAEGEWYLLPEASERNRQSPLMLGIDERNSIRGYRVRMTNSDSGLTRIRRIDDEGRIDGQNRIDDQTGNGWKHRVGGVAHGPPRLMTGHGSILVLENAQFLSRLDPRDGSPVWRRPVGPSPLDDSARQIVVDRERVLAVSDGALRCFSTEDGRLLWQRYVGGERYALKSGSGIVICVPAHAADTDRQGPARIVICNAGTGRMIQRLSVDGRTMPEDVRVMPSHCLIRTSQSIVCLRPWTAEQAGLSRIQIQSPSAERTRRNGQQRDSSVPRGGQPKWHSPSEPTALGAGAASIQISAKPDTVAYGSDANTTK